MPGYYTENQINAQYRQYLLEKVSDALNAAEYAHKLIPSEQCYNGTLRHISTEIDRVLIARQESYEQLSKFRACDRVLEEWFCTKTTWDGHFGEELRIKNCDNVIAFIRCGDSFRPVSKNGHPIVEHHDNGGLIIHPALSSTCWELATPVLLEYDYARTLD